MRYIKLRIIVSLVITLLVVSCFPLSVKILELDSPDGYYTAELSIKDRGSCCSASASITLYDNQDRIGESELLIFEGVGGWPIELHWIGPREMVLEFCDAHNYKVRSGIFESKEIDKSNLISRIKIQIVTLPNVVIGEQIYCSKNL